MAAATPHRGHRRADLQPQLGFACYMTWTSPVVPFVDEIGVVLARRGVSVLTCDTHHYSLQLPRSFTSLQTLEVIMKTPHAILIGFTLVAIAVAFTRAPARAAAGASSYEAVTPGDMSARGGFVWRINADTGQVSFCKTNINFTAPPLCSSWSEK